MIHFFALLRSDNIKIRRIPLEQTVEDNVKALFTSHYDEYFNGMNLEAFVAGYTPQEDTTSFVNLALPTEFNDIPNNTNVYSELDRDHEITDIKVIFIHDELSQTYYFQNFDKRNLLSRKAVAFSFSDCLALMPISLIFLPSFRVMMLGASIDFTE